MATKPATLPSILKMKCPKCRRGNMFTNKHIFPLNKMMDMPKRCTTCGQRMEIEVGFYFGTYYVSYGLCVAICVINAILYQLIKGFSVKGDSIYWYMGITIAMLLILQPWLMRISRVLYLWVFVRYNPNWDMETNNSATKQEEKLIN